MTFDIVKRILISLSIILLLTGCDKLKTVNASDINSMMEHLRSNLPAIRLLIYGFSFVAGIFLLYGAVYKLRAYGVMTTMMPSRAQFIGPLMQIFIGIMLMALPTMVKVSVYTLWRTTSALQYDYVGIFPSDYKNIEQGVFGIIQIFGYISFVRGLIMLKSAAQEGAPHGIMGKGMVHIIGGILCINIVGTVNTIRATFGI